MNVEEFKEIIAQGREQRGIEFKQGGSKKDKRLLTKVVRAIIGMANRRDGGRVIIGVSEGNNGLPIFDGILDADLSTWSYDELADSLAEYTDPGVNFDLDIIEYESKKFIVIIIHEFEDIPVLCKKNYPEVLRAGACYIRTRRKPETLEIPTQADMRDLLDLAIEKGVRRFVAQARASGLSLSGQLPPTDAELFNQQLEDFLGEAK
jgi:predicted HTH transcriptional regulator